MSSQPPDAIQKTIRVACSPEVAFRTWTEFVDRWWPKQHSWSGDLSTTIVIEPHIGGRFYERTRDGTEYTWGQVIEWDPPAAFSYHWYLGSSLEQPTRVDVRFVAEGGSTRVDLTHSGADLIGAHWLNTSVVFDRSWDTVLPAYHTFQLVFEDTLAP